MKNVSAALKLATTTEDRMAAFERPTITVDGLIMSKGAIYDILPVLEGADAASQSEFCSHVLFKDFPLKSEGAQAIASTLGYKQSGLGFNQSVYDIVLKSYKCGVFNPSDILAELQPEEIEMMRGGQTTNIYTFLSQRERSSAQDARVTRNSKEANQIPVYVGESEGHRILAEKKPQAPLVLASQYIQAGIDPDRRLSHVDQPGNRPGKNPRPMFFDYLVNRR